MQSTSVRAAIESEACQPSSTILVIDDDEAVRDSIRLALEQDGFRVVEAADGERGLSLFETENPDLVLCDLRMPQIDGMSVLKELSLRGTETPIIVISGLGVMSDVVEALRLGASDYFIKPIVDMAVLEHSIRRCLEESQLKRDNTRYRQELERANSELEANLRMLEQDQQAGRHIQMRLLPPSPRKFGAYTFSHRIIPSFYLSGDFVEYLLVGEDKVTFFIADISGHGASSAFVTALLKNFTAHLRSDYRKYGRVAIVKPVQFLQKCNHDMLRTEIGKHMTMCIGVIDTTNNTLTYSVAGHLPLPILITPDGARYLQGRGMPVGLFERPEYEEQVIDLPESFTLALFSDGILEILPPGELVEKEQVLLDRLHSGPGDIDELSRLLDLDSVTDAPDDIAVLMITR